MSTYILTKGNFLGADGRVAVGEAVELTEEEAAGHLDKLMLAGAERKTAPPSDPFDSFPHAELLRAAGFTSAAAVSDASDEELLAIEGIGKKSLADIRAAL